jgi:hypothetical protein
MVTLIHNLITTDYLVLVHDDDCVMGLKVIQEGAKILAPVLGVKAAAAKSLVNLFGISGLCNILGSIKLAKALKLGPKDNVVTIATDSFDRYPSVMVDLGKRMGRIDDGAIDEKVLSRWAVDVFKNASADEIMDVRSSKQKGRLFQYKEDVWTQFGYSTDYLNKMKTMDFWEKEFAMIPDLNKEIEKWQVA